MMLLIELSETFLAPVMRLLMAPDPLLLDSQIQLIKSTDFLRIRVLVSVVWRTIALTMLGSESMTISNSSVFARNIYATCTATMYICMLFSSIHCLSSIVQVHTNSELSLISCCDAFSKHSCIAYNVISLICQSLICDFSITINLFRSKISARAAS